MTMFISYYGSKMWFVRKYMHLILDSRIYCEPFAGGATVFFYKKPSYKEILNDLDPRICEIYKTFQLYPKEMVRRIKAQILDFDEITKKGSEAIAGKIEDPIEKVNYLWHFLLMEQKLKHRNKPLISWKTNLALVKKNRIKNMKRFISRLMNAEITRMDAFDVIKKLNKENVFLFVDPPYFNAASDEYFVGMNKTQYTDLIMLLSKFKGKFVLTCYYDEKFYEMYKEFNWNVELVNRRRSAYMNFKNVTETIVYNFNNPLESKENGKYRQEVLFTGI